MKLFYSINSPYARKCRMVVIEKGLQNKVEFVQVDPWASPAELLAVNPLSKIPAMITAEGKALCESPVICEYLDTLAPTPKLFPEASRLEVLTTVALADGIMDEAVGYVIETLKRPKNLQWPDYIKRKEEGVMRTISKIPLPLREGLGEGLAQQTRTSNSGLPPTQPSPSRGEGLTMATIATAVALAYVSFRMPHLNWRGAHPGLANWLGNFAERESMQQTQPIG